MKEFVNMLMNDFRLEGFTWKEMLVYGVLVPAILIAIMALAGWMDQISQSL